MPEHFWRWCRACENFRHRECPGPASTCDCLNFGHQPPPSLFMAMEQHREQRAAKAERQ